MRRRVLHSALRRYLVCVAILMALAIGRSALCDDSAAKPAEEKPTAEKADAPKHAPGHATDPTLVFKTVHIFARQSANDEPLADASFKVRYYWKNKTYQPLYKTDEKGEVDIELPTNRSQGISLECHPKKLVPVYYYWDGRSRDIAPPAELKLQFEPAVTIGGTVKDEAAPPIAKAKIELHMTPTFSEMSNFVFTVATLTTDAQGHWQCDTAPADVQALSINVSHPDYLRDGSTGRQTNQSLLDQSAVTTLKQGLKVVGHVFDEQAQPIAGATVQFGDRFGYGNPETKTDEEGKFTLKNCNAGSSFITVIAKGFAPDMQDVVVEARADKAQSSDARSHEGDQSGDIEFKLKPGGKITGRVVDTAGTPLKAVWIVSDTWRSRRSLKWEVHTDADGKFESDNAPPDAMQCDILANGYLSIRRFVMQPQAEPYEIVVHPIPTVTGKVTDAETGKPIEKFSVIPGIIWEGRQDTYWERDGAMQFTAGKYETRYSEPRPQVALMVEAEGYQPSYSEPFKLDQDTRTIDFKLSKGGAPFGGVVIDSDGHPVEGADIAMLGAGSQLSFRDGLIDRRQNRNSPHATTDKEGKFKLANMDPPYVVIATHAKAGYAEIFTDQTTDNFEVQLLPWGRIEGQLMIGDKPAADQPVTYQRLRESSNLQFPLPKLALNNPAAIAQMLRPNAAGAAVPPAGPQAVDLQSLVQRAMNNELRINMSQNTQVNTDAQGRFAFEHVIPGRISVMREIVIHRENYWTNTPCYGVNIDVGPSETAKVTLGGTGRAVIGHVEMPLVEGKKFDWGASDAIEVGPERGPNFAQGEGDWYTHRYCGIVAKDGNFRLDDIPPGVYSLNIRINKPGAANPGNPFGQPIGTVTTKFTIPEFPAGATREAEPLDLGELTPNLNLPAAGK